MGDEHAILPRVWGGVKPRYGRESPLASNVGVAIPRFGIFAQHGYCNSVR